MMTPERIFTIAGAVVAVLLQLLVAPYIAVSFAIPNFIIAFTMVIAILRPHSFGCVMPFVLGLTFDMIGGGPVGGMAFSLTLFSYLLARYFVNLGNDSLVISLAFVALGILLVELSYAVFLLLFGYNANLFDALAYRMVPCFLYDLVIALLLFPLAKRFVQPTGVTRTDITRLR